MSLEMQWRIVDRATDYEVNEDGVVRRAVPNKHGHQKHRVVCQTFDANKNHCGPLVQLHLGGKNYIREGVRNIVAAAFLQPHPAGGLYHVAFKDGDQLNTHWTNLEWRLDERSVIEDNGLEWRKLTQFPDYSIREDGVIRRDVADVRGRNTGAAVKPFVSKNPKKYPMIRLIDANGNQRPAAIHVLVAATFIGIPDDPELEVAHWDGNNRNYHRDNLRWATHKDNLADMKRHGRKPGHKSYKELREALG